MHFGSLLLLACGLAMDAAAVAAARGLLVPVLRARHFALVAVFFGGFQALMPLLGWLPGHQLGPLMVEWSHWIAFVLLTGLGVKMFLEAKRVDAKPPEGEPFALPVMFALALATSLDAFAAGAMLPLLGAPLWPSVITIGVVTALLSMAGLLAGRRFGALLGSRLDVLGGLVLIALGVKILAARLAS